MARNVLITGSSGKLGSELVRVFPNSLVPSHKELEITDRKAVANYIDENTPELVIHCAALTGIRECEDNKDLAWRVNVQGTENLVKACEDAVPRTHFAYISTACVFYGDRGNYVETDIPYPKNFYSLTKLLGEFVVKHSKLERWLIIRTNFVAREKWPYPKAFADRFGTYLFADDLARAIKDVTNKDFLDVLHVCGEEKISMYELAKMTTPDVQPMTLAEYKGPPLTVDMSLNTVRIKPVKMTSKKIIMKTA